MEIKALSSFNNQSFLGGKLLKKHVRMFDRVNTEAIEEMFRKKGISANFKGRKLLAGLSLYACEVARRLKLFLPPEFGIRKTPKDAIAQSWFLRDRKPHRFAHRAVQYGTDRAYSSLKMLHLFMKRRQDDFGTTHFLNTPLHEIMHSHIYKLIEEKYPYWHCNWDKVIEKKFSKIDISPFADEINNKIATYASKDALELHATYWAKEICMALNSDLIPKYNPFKSPKMKLSPLLREFIDKISQADYNGAKAVSRKAKKLQKTA